MLSPIISHYPDTITNLEDRTPVTAVGMVGPIRHHTTKNLKLMAFVSFEDLEGKLDLVVFPNTWRLYGDLFIQDAVLVIEGRTDNSGKGAKLIVENVFDKKDFPSLIASSKEKLSQEDLPEVEITVRSSFTPDNQKGS